MISLLISTLSYLISYQGKETQAQTAGLIIAFLFWPIVYPVFYLVGLFAGKDHKVTEYADMMRLVKNIFESWPQVKIISSLISTIFPQLLAKILSWRRIMATLLYRIRTMLKLINFSKKMVISVLFLRFCTQFLKMDQSVWLH